MRLSEFQFSIKGYLINILTCGYTGYQRASQMAQGEAFKEVNLKGDLLNVMWLVPLFAGLFVLAYTANLIFHIFWPGDVLESILNIVFVYFISFFIFQLLSSLLALQLSSEITFHKSTDKILFVVFAFSQPVDLVDNGEVS